MRARSAGRFLLTLYVGAYLCLLVPLHLRHLTTDFSSRHNLEQGSTEGVQASHHSDTCPVCQLTSGLIDLPTQHNDTTVLQLVFTLTDGDANSLAVIDQPRPSPRAPPVIG